MLEINASKLDSSYKAAKAGGVHWGIFQPSFLIPANPLSSSQADDVQLMQCAQCEKVPAHKTCSQCKVCCWCVFCLGPKPRRPTLCSLVQATKYSKVQRSLITSTF